MAKICLRLQPEERGVYYATSTVGVLQSKATQAGASLPWNKLQPSFHPWTPNLVLLTTHQSAAPGAAPAPPTLAGRYRTWYDQRARTTVLVNLAGVLERCNEQTLPALYKVAWGRGGRSEFAMLVQQRTLQARPANGALPLS
jgi:hypothetical protein